MSYPSGCMDGSSSGVQEGSSFSSRERGKDSVWFSNSDLRAQRQQPRGLQVNSHSSRQENIASCLSQAAGLKKGHLVTLVFLNCFPAFCLRGFTAPQFSQINMVQESDLQHSAGASPCEEATNTRKDSWEVQEGQEGETKVFVQSCKCDPFFPQQLVTRSHVLFIVYACLSRILTQGGGPLSSNGAFPHADELNEKLIQMK
ncbi:hypothetical protein Esti_004929 [Eimeria stiedai]